MGYRDFTRRVAARGFSLLGPSLIAVILAVVFDLGLSTLPKCVYELRSPSIVGECEDVKPGMDRYEVLAIFHRRTQPYYQYLYLNQLRFARSEAGCVVDLDPASHRVVKAQLNRGLAVEWAKMMAPRSSVSRLSFSSLTFCITLLNGTSLE